jgi:hypothetical protein
MSRIAVPALLAALVTLSGCAAPAPPSAPAEVDSADMQSIVDADQADREPDLQDLDWATLAERDATRRERVRALLDAGSLRTGKDFASAALVFQHGATSNDILLAHVLAMTAVAQGDTDSRRLAAMTLDRHLARVGQSQVFGTQFSTSDFSDPLKWTLEPYDVDLIPDALRAINCVASRESTEQLLARMKAGDMTDPPAVCPEGDGR